MSEGSDGSSQKMSASESPKIPEKLFFRINEVSDITGIPSYILRFWETEFPMLKPERDEKGERRYRKSDIELILQIKKLVYEEKYTLAGARKQLKLLRKGSGAANATPEPDDPTLPVRLDQEQIRELTSTIHQLRTELTELYRMLGS
jgi:DNA-binding transcriptional MerR regulator